MRIAVILSLALSLALPSFAVAEEPSMEQIEEAREKYNAAAIAFAEGRYAEAEASFRQVYVVLKTPSLLFETGLAMQRQGKWREASLSFSAYLRTDDKMGPKKRMRIDRQVLALRKRADWQDKLDAVAKTGRKLPPPTKIEQETDRQLMSFGATEDTPDGGVAPAHP